MKSTRPFSTLRETVVAGAALALTSTCPGEVHTFGLDPMATFLLHPDTPVSAPLVIPLEEVEIEPGDAIRLSVSGTFQCNLPWNPACVSNSTNAVFSSDGTILANGMPVRVPGAIAADAPPRVTGPNCPPNGSGATDIPEDFDARNGFVVTVPAGAGYLIVGSPDCWNSDNFDDDGDYMLHLEKVDPAATIVSVAVHGQVPGEFDPLASPGPPAWIASVPARVQQLVNDVNDTRSEEELAPVAVRTVPFDWSVRTGHGTPEIAASRLLYALGAYPTLVPPVRTAAWLIADEVERHGRGLSSAASRQAGAALAAELASLIARIREQHSEDHEIFLDVVAHSRGTTVVSRALELLRGDPVAGGSLEVNVVYVDAIDPHPSEADLPRPFALAGHLLGDPIVAPQAGERRHHLVASCAVVCPDFECSGLPDEDWFFTPAQFCELALNGVVEATDESLRALGHPRGHARPYLAPIVEEICAGSTHASVLDGFVDAFLGDGTSPCGTIFASVTRFGDFLDDPLADPDLVPFVGSAPAPLGAPGCGDGLLVADPSFDASRAIVVASTELLEDEAFDAALTPAFADVRQALETATAASFPSLGPWSIASGMPVIDGDASSAFVRFGESPSTIVQSLAADSSCVDRFEIQLDVVLLDAGADLVVRLDGPGLESEIVIDAASGEYPIGRAIALALSVERIGASDPTEGDVLRLTGSRTRLDRADVVDLGPACPGDLDGDGAVGFGDLLAVLTASGAEGGAEDLDGSGIVDFGDLLILLTAWGPCA